MGGCSFLEGVKNSNWKIGEGAFLERQEEYYFCRGGVTLLGNRFFIWE